MKNIFIDINGRVRSGWRFLAFLISFLILAFIFILAFVTIVSLLPDGPSAGSYLPLIIRFAISSVLAIVLGWIYGHIFEGIPFRGLGISFRSGWLGHFAFGCLVGAIALSSAIIVAVTAGGMSLSLNHESAAGAVSSTLITTSVIFFVGALSEETLFRGYMLQTLKRSGLVSAGVLITSLLFAFAHNSNPDVSPLALLNTFLAGIWFAVAYLKTRDLWFPLGIHFMWNLMQGPVFGINVSGISDFSPDPVLRASDAGPAWLTGGKYGIEGGVACTIALIISMGLVYLLPRPNASDEMLKFSEQPSPSI